MFRRAIQHSLIVLAGTLFFVALCATFGIPPSDPDAAAADASQQPAAGMSADYDPSARLAGRVDSPVLPEGQKRDQHKLLKMPIE